MPTANSSRLQVLQAAPEDLWQTPAQDLAAKLGGPALIEIAGDQDDPLFVSVLLHGNEVSGWDGLCRLMRANPRPRRRLLAFVGNVAAAAAGLRTLDGQQDFNRIWRNGEGPEGDLARSVLERLRSRQLFAAVDLHNNTGRNPHYSVLTRRSRANLALAGLFSTKAVFVDEPDTVLSRALDDICPSLAVELGPVADATSADRAHALLEALVDLDTIPESAPELDLFRAVARVHVPDDVEFTFAGGAELPATPLTLTGGMEAVNFHSLPAGTEFGALSTDRDQNRNDPLLRVLDPTHRDVTGQFLDVRAGRIELKRPVVPAMYTTDERVVRQDCLCYFMERLPAA